ncbi:unnamed protein product [Cylicostephanus goldi]|uniref:Uncharacterized protein n=1 Tax=Cylicostephanus goldi TaxID=71465 RepID=A0A3P6RUR7_CYLGO|nr:unnamed protein product [Cylicostephanus goldi]
MARHLGNYMNHSEKHSEIFYLFLQATNLERAIKMSTADVSVADRSRYQVLDLQGKSLLVPISLLRQRRPYHQLLVKYET